MAVEKFFENITLYLEARFELFKLDFQESVATAIGRVIHGIVVGLFTTLVVVFFSIGLANILNVWLQYSFAGYFIVAGIYLLPVLFFISDRGSKWMRERIEQSMEVVMEKNRREKNTGSDFPTSQEV